MRRSNQIVNDFCCVSYYLPVRSILMIFCCKRQYLSYRHLHIPEHRKKSYPHMPVPLKANSKSMRRRSSQPSTSPASTPPFNTPRDDDGSQTSNSEPPSTHTPQTSLQSKVRIIEHTYTEDPFEEYLLACSHF